MDYEESQFLVSRFGSRLEKMPVDSISLEVIELGINGKVSDVPAIVVKGDSNSHLNTYKVAIRLAGIHTPFCPVVTLDLTFPFQQESFTSSYWSFLPMHSMEQRSLLRIIANSEFWFLVVFSGNIPTDSTLIPIGQTSSDAYKKAWNLISQYPLDPEADTKSALNCLTRFVERVVPGFQIWDLK